MRLRPARSLVRRVRRRRREQEGRREGLDENAGPKAPAAKLSRTIGEDDEATVQKFSSQACARALRRVSALRGGGS